MARQLESQGLSVPDDRRAAVAELVDRFRRQRDLYTRADYKEEWIRQEFISPFFEALGWDMANRQGLAPRFREVVPEESLRVGGSVKAPDYSFRIGGQRVFFVEAKPASARIEDEPGPAYQLRRYGWSAKLPLSILTDFEEFAVYDCRRRP